MLAGTVNVVQVFSLDNRVDYQVTDVTDVSRTDVGVLDPTPEPTLTLITCTGVWLPAANDYAERLIVRATKL